MVVWRGTRAALRASEPFGTYLGLGLTAIVGFQAAVNMSVAMGLLPTKGLTLPFISYGGMLAGRLDGGGGRAAVAERLLRAGAQPRTRARPTDLRERCA